MEKKGDFYHVFPIFHKGQLSDTRFQTAFCLNSCEAQRQIVNAAQNQLILHYSQAPGC